MIKARLSDAQKQVVQHNDGALLVVAGPGSGKTRVLTERVRRLLKENRGHFRVLALTFTNKAANEMRERLADLGEVRQRAFIGTLHGFCLEVLADRGKLVGVSSMPQIFEQAQDRKQILVQAALDDPVLVAELDDLDTKERGQRIDQWLRGISLLKAHPISSNDYSEPLLDRVYEAYNAGLRACDAYDFDDLLLLTYRLFSDFPQVADFYRRLYKYVCIDEGQDLNEAQYAVLRAFCGDSFKNVMLVGDPKQSIYGFNTSSPEYLHAFQVDFDAKEIELQENFRSSKAVVQVAQSLDDRYMVSAQLPIAGEVRLLTGETEDDEASKVVEQIQALVKTGHPDIEGAPTLNSFAVLARTRYVLIAIEKELAARHIPFYKRVSAAHENESKLAEEFQLALRVFANPKDILHLAVLAKRWSCQLDYETPPHSSADVVQILGEVAKRASSQACMAVANAIAAIHSKSSRLDLMKAIETLEAFADSRPDDEKRAIREDLAVFRDEWDQYLRSDHSSTRSIQGFLSSMALGTTGSIKKDGVALLTVHSSKGLEFDVVFLVGMADGVFPDYRARGKIKALEEERRNAFVAVTRSKRLLYFSYPKKRTMPWGDVWIQSPSIYLRNAGLV